MSIKVHITASEETELDEALEALAPVIRRRKCRVKRKQPGRRPAGGRYAAYVEEKNSCRKG